MNTDPTEQHADNGPEQKPASTSSLLLRGGIGGGLMGLANIVPGISGGTMLLATGIFPQFIQAVADVTRLRFKRDGILLLASILIAAAIAIGLLAGPVSSLIIHQTWIMYSFFIGLTLGGAPLIWQMVHKKTFSFWLAAIAGLAGMILLSIVQISGGTSGGATEHGFILLLFAGTLGAGAMVLPGISGSYLLLLLGVYVPILRAIEQIVNGLRMFSFETIIAPAFGVALPVAIGIAIGVAGVSNLVKYLLNRFPNQILGILFGLLLGAVAGLWPFQHGIPPEQGSILKGQTIIEQNGELIYQTTAKPVDPADFPRETFKPSIPELLGAAGIIGFGFALTLLIGRLGNETTSTPSTEN